MGNPQEGTLGDYSAKKPGDNIYFFINRKIYGIGVLKDINGECAFCNFPNSSTPIIEEYNIIKPKILFDFGKNSIQYRWICLFEPSPHFFMAGIDMDDVLSSNPSKFKMLRAFWKLSFIKIDDEENKTLRDVLLKNNYLLNVSEILRACSNNNKIEHEMVLETGTLYQIKRSISNSDEIF